MTTTTRDCQIDYVEFPTIDIPAARAFYERAFGWKFEDYGPEYTSFSESGIAGGFAKREASSSSGPLVVIYVDDLATAEQRVKEAGGTIVKERFSFPGGARFHFRDPGGNELAAWHGE